MQTVTGASRIFTRC